MSKVHFTLARAASHLTARQQVQLHCGLEAFPVTSTRLRTHDGMRWLWNVVGDASRALELGVFVGGLERGIVPLLLFHWGGEGPC